MRRRRHGRTGRRFRRRRTSSKREGQCPRRRLGRVRRPAEKRRGNRERMTRRAWLMAVAAALRKQRVEEAAELVRKATASGEVRAAVLDVRQGEYRFSRAFGEARGPEDRKSTRLNSSH